jgi:hypothetical protein
LQALAKLKATRHAGAIRRCLRHADPDVRREANKALKKLGLADELPPPPVHLVKGRARIRKGLAEWSQNLDLDELRPTLAKLSQCVDKGFGPDEVAEVVGVVEAMRPEQTKTFCFPVGTGKKRRELWLSVFMDDVDSPDLAVYADGDVIARLGSVLSAK